MRHDLRAFAMQPLVPVGMVEMPVRVNQMFHRTSIQGGKGFTDSEPRSGDTGVDQNLAILAGQHRDIATGAVEDTYLVAQSNNLDFCCCCAAPDRHDRTFVRGKHTAWQ